MHLSDLIRPAELPERYTKGFIIGIGLCTAVELIDSLGEGGMVAPAKGRRMWSGANKNQLEPVRMSRKPWVLPGLHFRLSTWPVFRLSDGSELWESQPPSSWPSCWKTRWRIRKGCDFYGSCCCSYQAAEPAEKPQVVGVATKPHSRLQTKRVLLLDFHLPNLAKVVSWFTLAGNCAGTGFLETLFHLR